MCMLCVEIQKQYMSPREIASAYRETVLDRDDDHWIEVMSNIHKHSSIEKVSEAFYDLRKESDESKNQPR